VDHREDPLGVELMSYAQIARRFLATLEPIADTSFFSPEIYEETAKFGVEGWQVYFMGRAAPMGPVPASVVTSTFYNFSPAIVEPSVRWDLVSPGDLLAARAAGLRRTLERLLGAPDVSRAVELLREAIAACKTEGRPLFAAWAAQPWPEHPLQQVWHGATLLREYRGDGHIALLVTHGLSATDAIIMHAAFRDADLSWILMSRAWGDPAYGAARERLAARGFVNADGTATDAGMKFRDMIEHETDKLATPPFEALGAERSEELLALLQPLAAKIVEGKGVPRAVAHVAKDVDPVAP